METKTEHRDAHSFKDNNEGVPHFGLNVISLPCVLGGLLSPSSKSG